MEANQIDPMDLMDPSVYDIKLTTKHVQVVYYSRQLNT